MPILKLNSFLLLKIKRLQKEINNITKKQQCTINNTNSKAESNKFLSILCHI